MGNPVSCILIISFLSSCSLIAQESAINYPELEEISSIDNVVVPYLEMENTYALAIGIYQNETYHFYNYGKMSDENPILPDSLTIFEIGSISKTFTGALLNLAVEEGRVAMDTSIGQYLPENLGNWEGDSTITLKELSTHTSGLPQLPNNMMLSALANMDNPYKNYSVDNLYEFLEKYSPIDRKNRASSYSNLGVGLLGHILASKNNSSYEQLLEENITQPLNMNYTSINLNEEQQDLLAQGHNKSGKPTSNWDIPTLAGAGAIRSNTLDMLKYLKANLDGELALDKTHQRQVQFTENQYIGLGWITNTAEPNFTWHNGGTGGYRSFCGFRKDKNIGVVVLSNTAVSVDEIGVLLLKYLAE